MTTKSWMPWGREAVDEGVESRCSESPFFGGDGVRGLTSTTLRLSEDKEDDIAEAETVLDASAGAAEVEELLLMRPSSRGEEERGDEDRERGTTSTTFNVDEYEVEPVAVDFAGSDIRGQMIR